MKRLSFNTLKPLCASCSAILLVAAMGLSVNSCTNDPETDDDGFEAQKPDPEGYEYLADYDVLKNYTDANIGASVDAAAYNKGGEIASLINSNFDEVVASYHMKHGAVVNDNGDMDLATVTAFVDKAIDAGLNVYGHALCWHSGQNATYLNSLVADRWVADDAAPAAAAARVAAAYQPAMFVASRVDEQTSWSDNYLTDGEFEGDAMSGNFFVSNNGDGDAAGVIVADGDNHVLKLENHVAGENYHAQLGVQIFDNAFAAGEVWKLSFDVKSENGIAFSGSQVQNNDGTYAALGGTYYGDIATTTEWSKVELLIDVDADKVETGCKVLLGFGHAADVIYVDNVVLAKQEVTLGGGGTDPDTDDSDWTEIMFDGDFAESNKGVTYDIYNAVAPDATYEVIEESGNKVLSIDNTEATVGENYKPQLAILLPSGNMFGEGETWQLKFKVKSTNASAIEGVSFQADDSGTALSNKYYSFSTTTDWQEQVMDIDVDGEGLATAIKVVLGLGGSVDTFVFDDISFLKKNTTGGGDTSDPDTDTGTDTQYEWGDELIVNGDFETAVDVYETDSWLVQVATQTSGANIAAVDGVDGGVAVKVVNAEVLDQKWDTQLLIKPNVGEFTADDIYKVSFDIKSDGGSTITGSHSQNATYGHAYDSGDITTTTEWKHYDFIITDAAGGLNFAMQFGDLADTFYFDNLSFKKGTIIPSGGHYEPLSDEEKKAAVTKAMQDWVTAIIGATKGKVSVWDVVNESIDDDTPTSLRTGNGKDAAHLSENFYWQDYLGDNYVRDVVRMAREAAGDEKLTLFINDYGLEFLHDNNAKCDALIDWIEEWESDSETVIDGIGSQMHVSLSLDGETQARQKLAVISMFEKLAATGKLIKISEIDMRIVKADGTYLKTSETTAEQDQEMADYYEFIVSKYFELIPAEQQYGITHWSPTDATNDEYAWCAGEPIGLWTTDYARKHTYAGFVAGLQGAKE